MEKADYNMFDGVINNTTSVSELEASKKGENQNKGIISKTHSGPYQQI